MTTQTSAWQGDQSYPQHNGRAVPGTVIGGRYRLRAAVGTGGMGTVWQASDVILNRDVAVKEVVLPPVMAAADRQAMYQRTMREARAAAALQHPSVVQVYDVVTEDNRPWIIMELLNARSLAEMIIADGPLNPRAVAKIGVALLGALEVAHEAGVLHRDVKPANVLICTDGRCVLTDFGVARMPSESNLTTPGMVLGSPHFISPERAVGGAFGPPSDLFSLGVTLYTAVEGRPPFDRGDPFETMRAVVEEEPARMVRAGTLAATLTGLLEKDPDRRWTVNQARAALRDLLDGVLANRAVHHVTDPYAVVPPAPLPPRQDPPLPTGKVGGRAMIVPGAAGSADEPEFVGPAFEPTEPRGQRRRGEGPPPQWSPRGAAVLEKTDQDLVPVPRPGRATAAGGRGASGGRALSRLRRLPRLAQVGIAAGVVLALLLGAFVLTRPGSSAPQAGPPSTAPSSNAPLIPDAKLYVDRSGKFSLNVPGSWKQSPVGTYTDFTDPDDHGRRLRVNIEKAGSDPGDFLRSAENQLQKNTSSCPAPYNRVDLREGLTLDGRPAAELEYECGSGDTMRHGIWRATVVDKQAYEFFLTVPDNLFATSKVIYDEAVRSYQLTLS